MISPTASANRSATGDPSTKMQALKFSLVSIRRSFATVLRSVVPLTISTATGLGTSLPVYVPRRYALKSF